MKWLKRLFGTKDDEPAQVARPCSGLELDRRLATIREAGSVQGCHYTDHVDRVVDLKRQGKHPEAIDLLLQLVDGTEAEAKAAGGRWGVAPWYYEQLAIIYRKERRFAEEVRILERYARQPKAPGVGPGKLSARLEKARTLTRTPGTQLR